MVLTNIYPIMSVLVHERFQRVELIIVLNPSFRSAVSKLLFDKVGNER